MPEQKMFMRVDGQWKVYIGVPSESEKQQSEAVKKLVAALPQITADTQAGKFASIQELLKAIQEASAQAGMLGGPPNASPPGATPPPAP
jgi:hypothetical protein